ncbi:MULTISPECIES: RsfA family transcriptional regulator [Bacillus]|uniref:RsfA family transcriptional regulator n=1 Tax=Bacillus TaxID=1386 RepID=UPI0003047089|nr:MULTISPECIES: RsfA family transcriptional regulator [Bacillus]
MSVSRQDAWTQDEDLILAELVLRHIREGSTQLIAFEEVGKRLSRTPAACGFRWNSYVRKQYNSGIELAKKQRKESKKSHLKGKSISNVVEEVQQEILEKSQSISLKDVISFLVALENDMSSKGIEDERVKQDILSLQEENEILKKEVEEFESKLVIIEEDYRALIEIMDKARKMVISEESKKNPKVKFQMDKNGNLERVKK